MDFHVMTLFPDMIMDGLNTSITGRAIKAGVMSVKAYDIREYSNDKHLKVMVVLFMVQVLSIIFMVQILKKI